MNRPRLRSFFFLGWLMVAGFGFAELPALTIRGEDFVGPAGQPVRFWGVNLVALYPDHARADALATDLASRGINLVRPHHLLRAGKDWNPNMLSGALVTYKDNSRELDPAALDRFDYLNAALRRHGIYLALSTHFSRVYRAGDVDILKTTDADRTAWMAAMKELTGWNWQKNRDPFKMLPVVDERAALLNEEFIRNLLTHTNAFTGTTYAADPQVLTFEVLNESSTEYAIICKNKFPAYWQEKLLAKWKAFAPDAGDLYEPSDEVARAKFLRKLDEVYFERMKAVIRSTGCRAPVTFSNLWRGENALAMHARLADHMENHNYMDPLVVRGLDDGFVWLTKTALAGKPFIVGEFNQAEGAKNIQLQSPVRTMLPLAASAYASLQNWSGIIWFAWLHGDAMLGSNGLARTEGRTSKLGDMIADGMMGDHLRTTGIIYRRGLVSPSKAPVTLWVDEPFTAGTYDDLMRGKYVYEPGWQNVHAIRKAFGPVPEAQSNAQWLAKSPTNPVVSDTGQIIKDIERKQLTVAAPQTEGFSGYLDGKAPAGLKHLQITGEGFATVVVVADDGKDFGETGHLIISRTGLDAANSETNGPVVRLAGLKKGQWTMCVTRPGTASVKVSGENVELPGEWHECELTIQP